MQMRLWSLKRQSLAQSFDYIHFLAWNRMVRQRDRDRERERMSEKILTYIPARVCIDYLNIQSSVLILKNFHSQKRSFICENVTHKIMLYLDACVGDCVWICDYVIWKSLVETQNWCTDLLAMSFQPTHSLRQFIPFGHHNHSIPPNASGQFYTSNVNH